MKQKPFILINFKKVSGERAIALAKELEGLDRSILEIFDLAVAVLNHDSCSIVSETTLPVFLQDFTDPGDRQMATPGIRGVILNHPEKAMSHSRIQQDLESAQQRNLQVILCASSLDESAAIRDRYCADFIAVENRDLIGKDISLAESSGEYVEQALAGANGHRILFGGGIKSSRDINFVIDRGGAGVLVSSLIVKAEHPLEALTGLLDPKNYKNMTTRSEEASCQ